MRWSGRKRRHQMRRTGDPQPLERAPRGQLRTHAAAGPQWRGAAALRHHRSAGQNAVPYSARFEVSGAVRRTDDQRGAANSPRVPIAHIAGRRALSVRSRTRCRRPSHHRGEAG